MADEQLIWKAELSQHSPGSSIQLRTWAEVPGSYHGVRREHEEAETITSAKRLRKIAAVLGCGRMAQRMLERAAEAAAADQKADLKRALEDAERTARAVVHTRVRVAEAEGMLADWQALAAKKDAG